MGGKALKFPKRKKFVYTGANSLAEEKKGISLEEHEKRLKVLREMGIIK